jgi:hypothetical protein
MKTLLNHIKSKLKDDLSNIKTVEIVPHEMLFPERSGFPVITILDSGDKEDRGMHRGVAKFTVTIAAYQRVLSDKEASVMGSDSKKGVLEIIGDIKACLESEYFDGYVNLVKYLGSTATRAVTSNYKDFIAYKLCKFEYHKTIIHL